MQEQLMIMAAGISLAFLLLVVMLATYYQPNGGDEDDDDDDNDSGETIKIFKGDSEGSSGGGGGDGGGGGGSYSISGNERIKNNLKAKFVSDKEDADLILPGEGGTPDFIADSDAATISTGSNRQCTHCGAMNKEHSTICWNCGSKTGTTFGPGGLDEIANDVEKVALESRSHVVRKGDDPVPNSIEPPTVPEEDIPDPTETEEEGEDLEKIDLKDYYLGLFYGWIDKWKALVRTHFSSMMIVTVAATVIWGLSVVYGAMAFDTSGLISLIFASLIAIVSASLAVLFFLSPGKVKTIVLAYPFTLNVVLLPPIVIAINEPRLAFLLDNSILVAEFLLQNYASVLGVESWLRSTFNLQGSYFILMWFAISIPLGWFMGTTVFVVKYWHSMYNRYVDRVNEYLESLDEEQAVAEEDAKQPN